MSGFANVQSVIKSNALASRLYPPTRNHSWLPVPFAGPFR